MATALQPVRNVNDWLAANPQAPPEKLIEVLQAQIAVLQEESRLAADVEYTSKGDLRPKTMAGLYRIGTLFSRSQLVPEHFRGKPDDCTIAAQMALRCGVDILTFLQSCYIVHGRPGIEAKLAIAMLDNSGLISGRVTWKFSGTEGKPDWACTAMATDKLTGEVLEQTVTWAMVEAEGWNKDKRSKSSDYVQKSKWNTMPKIMFQYRSAMFLCRMNFPDVLMGMRTEDELEDINPGEIVQQQSEPKKISRNLAPLSDEERQQLDTAAAIDVGQQGSGSTDLSESAQTAETAAEDGAEQSDATTAEPATESDEQGTTEVVVPESSKDVDPLAGVSQWISSCKTRKEVMEVVADVRKSHKLSEGDEMRLEGWADSKLHSFKK